MGLVAAAIIGGAAVGAGATIYAGKESSKAQKEASKRSADAQERINAQQIAYQESLLGEGGVPVNLPRYTGPYESQVLFPEAQRIFDATGQTVASPAEYEAILNQARPTLGLSSDQIARLFSGDLTREQLGFLSPVADARMAVAEAQRQAISEGLAEERNRINAARARQGFVGGGSMANNQLLAATLRARTGAANTATMAELQNRLDRLLTQTRGQEQATQAAISGVPFQQVQRQLEVERLPAQYVGEQFAARLSPFRFFQVPSKPNALAIQAPQFQPITSTGQIVGTAIGQGASSVGNFFANKYFADQMNQQAMLNANPNYVGSVPGGGAGFAVPISALPANQSVISSQPSYIGDVNLTAGVGAV